MLKVSSRDHYVTARPRLSVAGWAAGPCLSNHDGTAAKRQPAALTGSAVPAATQYRLKRRRRAQQKDSLCQLRVGREVSLWSLLSARLP